MGLPIGGISILLAEYVSVPWGIFIVLLGSALVYGILRYVEHNSWRWLHLPPEPKEARKVARRLWWLYLAGLACSLTVSAF